MLINKKTLAILPSGGSHSKFRPDKMLAQRHEQYTKATRSQRKKQTKLRQKKKQERMREQDTARKSMEAAECGPKSNPPKQNLKSKADRQAKTEPRESAHSKEQSDQSSMSEE